MLRKERIGFQNWNERWRIEKLELRGVQAAEKLGERLARLETQPQSLSQLLVSGKSAVDPLREEHGRRIQELQIWVQALNGGTSALVHLGHPG